MTFYKAPTTNFVSTTLNGSINDSVTTITLNSTSNLPTAGYIIIDRQDGNGTATPNAREVVSYTGISGSNLTGCTRGADGSTNRSHNDGALVETVLTVGMWNGLVSVFESNFSSDFSSIGTSNVTVSAITNTRRLEVSSIASIARGEFSRGEFVNLGVSSIASISRLETKNFVNSSVASIARADVINLSLTSVASLSALRVATHIEAAAGASVVGFGGGLNVLFQVPGSLASQANIGSLVPIPAAYTANFIEAFVQTPASVASVSAFILKQGGTVVGMVGILGGGTYGSSASLAVTSLVAGDNLTLDIRSTASLAADLSVLLRSS